MNEKLFTIRILFKNKDIVNIDKCTQDAVDLLHKKIGLHFNYHRNDKNPFITIGQGSFRVDEIVFFSVKEA